MAAFHDYIRVLASDFEEGVSQLLTNANIDAISAHLTYEETEDGVGTGIFRLNALEVAIEYVRASEQRNVDRTPERARFAALRIDYLQRLLLDQGNLPKYLLDSVNPQVPNFTFDAGTAALRLDAVLDGAVAFVGGGTTVTTDATYPSVTADDWYILDTESLGGVILTRWFRGSAVPLTNAVTLTPANSLVWEIGDVTLFLAHNSSNRVILASNQAQETRIYIARLGLQIGSLAPPDPVDPDAPVGISEERVEELIRLAGHARQADLVAHAESTHNTDQMARQGLAAHEGTLHNRDQTARSAASTAQTNLNEHVGSPHNQDNAARQSISDHESTTHNRDSIARQVATGAQEGLTTHVGSPHNQDNIARQAAEAVQVALTAHETLPPAGGGGRW